MKTLYLFILGLFFNLTFAQNTVALKVQLYKTDNNAVVTFQRNNEAEEKINQNVFKNIDLKLHDKLSFYVNENLVETIDISQNIIDRRILNVLITESTVLDQIEIEYTDLNAKIGLGNESYSRTERAVKKDKQITNTESLAANVTIDGLVNKVSGRSKMNKKVLFIDNEVQAMERFMKVYSRDYLYDNYKLPKEKASYFALHMTKFIDKNTQIDDPAFKELLEQQLLNFSYED